MYVKVCIFFGHQKDQSMMRGLSLSASLLTSGEGARDQRLLITDGRWLNQSYLPKESSIKTFIWWDSEFLGWWTHCDAGRMELLERLVVEALEAPVPCPYPLLYASLPFDCFWVVSLSTVFSWVLRTVLEINQTWRKGSWASLTL